MRQADERMQGRYLRNLTRNAVRVSFVAVFVVVGVALAIGQTDTSFKTGCGALPFEDIALEHNGVDDFCGIEGVHAATDEANEQQNRLKNNFCLKGKPVVIATTDLLTLQKRRRAR